MLAMAASPVVFAVVEDDALQLPYYGEFSGMVKAINPKLDSDGNESDVLLVLVENDEGGQANFIIDEVTHMLTENELEVGSKATGYFQNNIPMILIYPPQYAALLMAVDVSEGQFIKVARFNDDLISDDNTLKLNIGENTKIELFDGETAPADLHLGGLRLAVYYGVSTRSIPAITTPDRIVVLALADVLPLSSVTAPVIEQARDGMPIVVEGKTLTDAPSVYVLADDTVMVPLRAIAEALGHEVGWKQPQVLLDGGALLSLGEYGSELCDNRTFVPLTTLKQLLNVNNAIVLRGQVEIGYGDIVE